MEHYTIRGRLRYTSRKPEIFGKERGGETWIITVHPDGSRTLRAHCAIDENPPRVLRDCVSTLGPDWKPRQAFVQLTVDEAFVGSAWYRFTDHSAECEGWTAKEGRISHRFETDGYPAYFGIHPIQADAWHLSNYDLAKGPGEQHVPNKFMCSLHHRGADGPTLMFLPQGSDLAFIGRETVTVEAGTFDALHFRFGRNDRDDYMGTDIHPPYHLWVSADGDYILLKAGVTGYMQTYYELVEYEKRKNFF
jgi:hypothetical protein